MTETGSPSLKAKKRRLCIIVAGVLLSLLLLMFIIILILSLTVFKVKDPKIQLISASLNGISPRISFPVINIQLNVTLNLTLLVYNPNYATFKHGSGKSYLYYKENEVGEADIGPGIIPSRGNVTFPCLLTIEVDRIASNTASFLSDIMAGQIVMESRTRIPGRATILGIFKKHAVAVSICRFTLSVSDMKISKQECKNKTKL